MIRNTNDRYTLKLITTKSSKKILAITEGRKLVVVEKIGSIDKKKSIVMINPFRLIFWLSKNIKISPKAFYFLIEYNILGA